MKTRARISRSALLHNLAVVRELAPGCPLMAMVKADAYGHGAVALLPTLASRADAFAVARLEEAQVLRKAGYQGQLLLLCGVSSLGELALARQLQLDILVHAVEQLELFATWQDKETHSTRFWLKLDTGMHRLGFAASDYTAACAALRKLAWCQGVIGMTHFASADEPGNPKTMQQIADYQAITAALPLDNHSLANSAALFAWPAARYGWVRPGLMLYGVNPVNDEPRLQAVMQLEASVIAVKTLQAGESTGYNERWRAVRESCVAFVAAGYADGYPITALNQSVAALNGTRVPVIGRVSMDTLAIDCTGLAPPQPGDWVELWGKTIAVADVARAAGSIPYQLLTAVSSRVTRIIE